MPSGTEGWRKPNERGSWMLAYHRSMALVALPVHDWRAGGEAIGFGHRCWETHRLARPWRGAFRRISFVLIRGSELLWRASGDAPEEFAEMRGLIEAKFVGDDADGPIGVYEQALCFQANPS